jgi:hypothetical protein
LIRSATDARPRREPIIRFVTRLLVAAYLIEAGLLLILAPWTSFWDRNLFAAMVPWIGEWMASRFVRGGVSGVGLVTMVAGLRDLTVVILTRHTAARAGDSRPLP